MANAQLRVSFSGGLAQLRSAWATPLPTIARPVGDLSLPGLWTPSVGSNFYSCIDEEVLDASDFVSTTGGGFCEVALSPVAFPGGSTPSIMVWASATAPTDLIVVLSQYEEVIAVFSVPVTITTTLYTLTLDGIQSALITSGEGLSISLTTSG